MAKILNFGSVNIDYVYKVDHFVKPGETLSAMGMERFPGGKGLNQSVALARAGADIWHAGRIGRDGLHLRELMSGAGVHTELLDASGSGTGQAIIQVERSGQNCILLHPAANFEITEQYIRSVLDRFEKGDLLLLQNEINMIDKLLDMAYEKGMQIAMNPSPISPALDQCDLGKVTWMLLNEVEGNALTGETNAKKILEVLIARYPNGRFVLTIGKDGVVYRDRDQSLRRGIYDVPVVDTTAAGDTFTGFFLSVVQHGESIEEALKLASIASSIAVSRKGAAVSIPTMDEVKRAEEDWGNHSNGRK